MNKDQKAAFEAWYMSDMFLCAPVDTIVFATDDNGYYLDSRIQAAWRGYRAALESQEVRALRKDAERYRHIRDSLGFNLDGAEGIVRFHVSQKTEPGVATYFYGDYLDFAIDAAMEKQK
jgi:hypothetical protein